MTQSMFTHVKCGGDLYIDVSGAFSMKSPSLSITPRGLTVGAFELSRKAGNDVHVEFQCSKCEKYMNLDEHGKILGQCSVCSKKKPLEELVSTYQISVICIECSDYIINPDNHEKIPAYLSPIVKYIKFSKSEKFTPLTELMKTITV